MADKSGSEGEDPKDKEIRKKMLFRLKEWKDDDFDTSEIEEIIWNEPDISNVKSIFKEFKDKVKVLQDIEVDLLLMSVEGYEEEVKKIESRVKDLSSVEEVKEDFRKFKAKVESAHGPDRSELEERKEKYLKKMDNWSSKGYEMDDFRQLVRREKDLERIRSVMDGLEKKVGVLEKVKALIDGLDADGFGADLRRIEKMVHRLDKVNKIWKEVYSLRSKIKERKKEVVKAEATTTPVRIKKRKERSTEEDGETSPGEEEPGKSSVPETFTEEPDEGLEEPSVGEVVKETDDEEIFEFRRIDLFVQLLQNILLANKRLLTLDTLRLAQRALKKDHPKVMFFLIQKDFKIKSMMPDRPESYKALEAYLNKLFSNLSGLIGEEEARERLRVPAKEYITQHIQEILASGLDDYFPVFLIIEEDEIPEEKPETVEVEREDWDEIMQRVHEWAEEGYDINRLLTAIENNRELALAMYRKTEEEIFWLKELEKDIEALEEQGLEEECKEIRKKLKHPERISEIEDDILSLQMMADVGERYEDDGDLI